MRHPLEIVGDDPKLPTPPDVAFRVLDLTSRPECSVETLTRVIRVDVSLAAKILKTVNSAAYRRKSVVTSLQQAITVLGLNTTRSLVLALSLPEMLRHARQGEAAARFWPTSIAGALAARELTRLMRNGDPEEEFAVALLR